MYDVIFLLWISEPNFEILYEYENISSMNQLHERLMYGINEKEYEIIDKIENLISTLIIKDIKSFDDLLLKLKTLFLQK